MKWISKERLDKSLSVSKLVNLFIKLKFKFLILVIISYHNTIMLYISVK